MVWEKLVQTISAEPDEPELPSDIDSSYVADCSAKVKELSLSLATNKFLNDWVIGGKSIDELA